MLEARLRKTSVNEQCFSVVTEVTIEAFCYHQQFRLLEGRELRRFSHVQGFRENGSCLPTLNPYSFRPGKGKTIFHNSYVIAPDTGVTSWLVPVDQSDECAKASADPSAWTFQGDASAFDGLNVFHKQTKAIPVTADLTTMYHAKLFADGFDLRVSFEPVSVISATDAIVMIQDSAIVGGRRRGNRHAKNSSYFDNLEDAKAWAHERLLQHRRGLLESATNSEKTLLALEGTVA